MLEQIHKSRLDDLLSVMPAGVVMLDGTGIVFEANSMAQDFLGADIIGKLWLDILTSAFAPKEDDGHEVSLHDGRRLSITINSLTGGEGQLILLQDMTETRNLQTRVSRYERLSAMGKMVASLAHQLRTPLATAMLYASHLQKNEINKEQRQKFASKLVARLEHMNRQIKDMTIFAKGETQMAKAISLSKFIEELQNAIIPVLESAEFDCDWTLPTVEIVYDKILIASLDSLIGAILNLVNNAIDASKNISKQLKIEILILDNNLLIGVQDKGQGMPPEILRQVSEPFFTTKSQGTGLGLAIVQAVIEAHNGKFSLHSKEGEGTSCWILLNLKNNS